MKNFIESKDPLLSIVTVVMNGERYLEETIKSVINQEYNNFEYIIIDGGSTDNTINIIKKYQRHIDKWISEPDKGQTDALIKGFSQCSGDILYWLNYDDLLHDVKTLELVAGVFKENNNIDLVYGDDLLVDKDLNVIKLRDFSYHTLGKLLYYKSISQPSTFFSKEVYNEFGLNEELNYSMDLDLWLKAFSKYNVKYLNRILSKNRIHKDRKMITFEREAKIESRKLRNEFGANKNMFNVYKFFFKILGIKNHFISLIYSYKK